MGCSGGLEGQHRVHRVHGSITNRAVVLGCSGNIQQRGHGSSFAIYHWHIKGWFCNTFFLIVVHCYCVWNKEPHILKHAEIVQKVWSGMPSSIEHINRTLFYGPDNVFLNDLMLSMRRSFS
jgi:hypothetical protein